MSISTPDYQIITKQIGREPIGAKEVLVRNKENHPRVIRVSPLVNKKPFGSFYWLSCPILKKKIDQIESNGEIALIQDNLLDQDEDFYRALCQDHEKYIVDRLRYIKEDDLEAEIAQNLWSSLQSRGVGGVQNFRSIRCLHMHYAHHLVELKNSGTVVGRYLDKKFDLLDL